MTVSALIFGSLGTLTETSSLHHKAFNETFAEEGLGWHWDDETYRRLLSHVGGVTRIVQYSLTSPDAVTLTVEQAAELHAKKTERYTRLVRSSGVEPRPGVARLLSEAKAGGVRVGLATGTSLLNINANLEATGGRLTLDDFDATTTVADIDNGKPAPDAHQRCMERLGVEPNNTIVIEDSYDGVSAAASAGALVIATPGAYLTGHDFSQAHLVVESLGDPGTPAVVIGGRVPLDSDMVTMAWLGRQF